jgi:type I restriction enzyme R subunit
LADFHENKFEEEICRHLEKGGWLYSPDDTGYDAERALFPEDVIGWLAQTEPEQLEKIVDPDGPRTEQQKNQLLDRLVKTLDQPLESGGGTLTVLRKGFKHAPARFRMCQFRPETALNQETVARFDAVRVRIMRQVHFSVKDRRSIDLVAFVNGLPVLTIELKTDFTQSVEEARRQYRTDRKPKTGGHREPLLSFGHRALVHFAVSSDEVWMTTRLNGEKTRFLPFNRGRDGGPGNPVDEDGGSPASYLWKEVLTRESLLDILQRFMHLETKETRDPATGSVNRSSDLLFPRYHQWEVVRKLAEAAAEEGPGNRYLIQHSAGSGKTNSIAWIAHRLARLSRMDGEKVFDSVIVVTDRNVLDAQLREAISQIDGDLGVVATIDRDSVNRSGSGSKSGLLAQALADEKLIIVVTIQTFPHALKEIRASAELKGKNFAVIADEAHSSQSGATAGELKKVLSGEDLAELEVTEEDGQLELDTEALLAFEMKARANPENISFFAFTATPKQKTMELFGRTGADGKPEPFHLYTMKQAIEEDFILDVLRGYRTYETAFRIEQKAEEEDLVDEASATRRVMNWVKLHPTNIDQKVAIIVEHFREKVAGLLDGEAKAMVVADSRIGAVRFKLAIDRYIEDKGYEGLGTLVAFSGSVNDPKSGAEPFTEAGMNPGLRGQDLRDAFATPAYRIMVVANKFQTGFSESRLTAMYVDKRLSGVTAVQTLSRLNRTYTTPSGEQKDQTMVIDFVNDPEKILKSFQPYYLDARVEKTTDPNLVHDLEMKLDNAGIYTRADVEPVAEAFLRGKGHEALAGAIAPVKYRFRDAVNAAKEAKDKSELERLEQFRENVGAFVRLYDFMSQIINYGDPDLEKLAIFLRLLERQIQPENYSAEVDLSGLNLTAVKQKDLGETEISLDGGGTLKPISGGGKSRRDPKKVALEEIIERLNDLFGDEDFTDGQKEAFVEGLVTTVLANEKVRAQAAANTPSRFQESPDLADAILWAVEDNQGSHNRIADFFYEDSRARDELVKQIGNLIHLRARQDDPTET